MFLSFNKQLHIYFLFKNEGICVSIDKKIKLRL